MTASISTQTIHPTGTVITYAAATSSGDTFVNDGGTILEIVNSHASASRTVTIAKGASSINTPAGLLALDDLVITVPALTTKRVGPLNPAHFNALATGLVTVTYSNSGADLTVAAVKSADAAL